MARTAKVQTKDTHTVEDTGETHVHNQSLSPPPIDSPSTVPLGEKKGKTKRKNKKKNSSTKAPKDLDFQSVCNKDLDGNEVYTLVLVKEFRTFRGQAVVDYTEPKGTGRYIQKPFPYRKYGFPSLQDANDEDGSNIKSNTDDTASDKHRLVYNHSGFENKNKKKDNDNDDNKKPEEKKTSKSKNNAENSKGKNKAVELAAKQKKPTIAKIKAADTVTNVGLETIHEAGEHEELSEETLPLSLPSAVTVTVTPTAAAMTKKTPKATKKKAAKKQQKNKKRAATYHPTLTTTPTVLLRKTARQALGEKSTV